VYDDSGDFIKAVPFHSESLAIRKEQLGEYNPAYATAVNNVGEFYKNLGLYTQAEQFYTQAAEIYKKVLGDKSSSYAAALNNLAQLYTIQKQYTKAEPNIESALEIQRIALGENHPDYLNTLINAVLLFEAQGKSLRAKSFLEQANSIQNKQISEFFSFLSEKEKEHYIRKSESFFDLYNSFMIRHKADYPEMVAESFNNELLHKGMILQSSISLKKEILNSKNPKIVSDYNRLIEVKQKLSQQYSLPKIQRTFNTDSLENIAEELEKKLLGETQYIQTDNDVSKKIVWTDVQKNLPQGSVAIEFISFAYYNHLYKSDSIIYCALVLKKAFTQPYAEVMFEEKELKSILNRGIVDDDYLYISDIYKLSSNIDSKGNRVSTILRRSLDQYINDAKTIYYAPSGLLHKVSLSAIPYNDSLFWSDRFAVQRTSSLRNMISKKGNIDIRNFTAVIYGGIKYDLPDESYLNNKTDTILSKNSSFRSSIPDSLVRGVNWSYLKGSLVEAKIIDTLMSEKTKNGKITFISDEKATEDSFKKLSNINSPDIIHIATHGFYFPDPKDESTNIERYGDISFLNESDPLMRSGILFAGGNRAWTEKAKIIGKDDGVLTAYELSQLYFPNTQLVVLSACETGLGEVRGNEGVFGMQRALKMSGVNNIIMSLWPVPDKQTQELMTYFYTAFLSGASVEDAFAEAQSQMKNKYINEPFVWGAFILIR
jgi:CHAT domain-containing protein/tetratricopeptide (TPR) repeat protein